MLKVLVKNNGKLFEHQSDFYDLSVLGFDRW